MCFVIQLSADGVNYGISATFVDRDAVFENCKLCLLRNWFMVVMALQLGMSCWANPVVMSNFVAITGGNVSDFPLHNVWILEADSSNVYNQKNTKLYEYCRLIEYMILCTQFVQYSFRNVIILLTISYGGKCK